jgi:pimeloyl-ACP methyl ester carboxylesterase
MNSAFSRHPDRYEQTDLFYDYRTNVESYPLWQRFLREPQPPTLVLWGRYDPSFTIAGANAYRDDVPDAEIHLLGAGHFALDEATDDITFRRGRDSGDRDRFHARSMARSLNKLVYDEVCR